MVIEKNKQQSRVKGKRVIEDGVVIKGFFDKLVFGKFEGFFELGDKLVIWMFEGRVFQVREWCA